MRALLATITTLLALSGCISDTNDTDEAPSQDRAAEPTVTPAVSDVRVMKAYDLSLGLESTSWSFEVADGGSGDVRLGMIGRVADQVVADPDFCLSWAYEGADSSSKGGRGMCPGAGSVVLTVNPPHLEHQTILEWDALSPGAYSITISAQPQPNILNVHIVVDNP